MVRPPRWVLFCMRKASAAVARFLLHPRVVLMESAANSATCTTRSRRRAQGSESASKLAAIRTASSVAVAATATSVGQSVMSMGTAVPHGYGMTNQAMTEAAGRRIITILTVQATVRHRPTKAYGHHLTITEHHPHTMAVTCTWEIHMDHRLEHLMGHLGHTGDLMIPTVHHLVCRPGTRSEIRTGHRAITISIVILMVHRMIHMARHATGIVIRMAHRAITIRIVVLMVHRARTIDIVIHMAYHPSHLRGPTTNTAQTVFMAANGVAIPAIGIISLAHQHQGRMATPTLDRLATATLDSVAADRHRAQLLELTKHGVADEG